MVDPLGTGVIELGECRPISAREPFSPDDPSRLRLGSSPLAGPVIEGSGEKTRRIAEFIGKSAADQKVFYNSSAAMNLI